MADENPSEEATVPPEEATVPPEETTVPPEEVTVPPEEAATEVLPDQTPETPSESVPATEPPEAGAEPATAEAEAIQPDEAAGEIIPEEGKEELPDEVPTEQEETREIDEEAAQAIADEEMMTAYDAQQDSLDALVKSSSMQIAQEKSMVQAGEDFSKTMMVADKRDKHAIKAKEVLGEVIDIRRGSTTGEAADRRTVRFMNTYKLDSDKPFNSEQVDKILETVMTEALEDLKYEPDKCCKQAKWASNTIKAKVKQMEFERYKIISVVSIGEKNNQDVLYTCRFLWDEDRDNYSCYTLENSYIFGIAICFGLYYE